LHFSLALRCNFPRTFRGDFLYPCTRLLRCSFEIEAVTHPQEINNVAAFDLAAETAKAAVCEVDCKGFA
jgi:hypothetical protein